MEWYGTTLDSDHAITFNYQLSTFHRGLNALRLRRSRWWTNKSYVTHGQHTFPGSFLAQQIVLIRRTEHVVQFTQRLDKVVEGWWELAAFDQLSGSVERLLC